MLDLSKVFSKIKHLQLKSYNKPFVTIFLSANDPDDACFLVIHKLIRIIIDQDPSVDMRIICRKLKRESRIDKIFLL